MKASPKSAPPDASSDVKVGFPCPSEVATERVEPFPEVVDLIGTTSPVFTPKVVKNPVQGNGKLIEEFSTRSLKVPAPLASHPGAIHATFSNYRSIRALSATLGLPLETVAAQLLEQAASENEDEVAT